MSITILKILNVLALLLLCAAGLFSAYFLTTNYDTITEVERVIEGTVVGKYKVEVDGGTDSCYIYVQENTEAPVREQIQDKELWEDLEIGNQINIDGTYILVRK